MDSVNTVILEGYISDYPEIRYFGYEHLRMKLRLHTIEKGLKADGRDWEQWHNIELSNALAKQAEASLKKGDYIRIEGRLAYHKNFDMEGNKSYSTIIHARSFILLEQSNNIEKVIEEPIAKQMKTELRWNDFANTEEEDPMA